MSTGLIADKFKDKMKNIPTHFQYSISNKSLKYAELLSAVDLMSKEKCIVFDRGEYEREYGKNAVAGLRANALKTKFPGSYVLSKARRRSLYSRMIYINDEQLVGQASSRRVHRNYDSMSRREELHFRIVLVWGSHIELSSTTYV